MRPRSGEAASQSRLTREATDLLWQGFYRNSLHLGIRHIAFKAARLQAGGVPWDIATASVVIHKGILVLSLTLYIFVGLALSPFFLPVAGWLLGTMSLAALGLAAAGITFVVVQRQGPCTQGVRLLARLGWRPRFLQKREARIEDLDRQLVDFYQQYPARATLAFILFFFSWMLHAVEVYIMFWLLGHPIGWGPAISLDALAMLFTALGFFIPAAMGVQEGGNLLLALGFNLGLPLGAAFSILRRLREAFWLSLGLIVVGKEK